MNIYEIIDRRSNRDKLFANTATAQRGVPEQLMVRLQHYIGGGVYSFVIEHVGDLTHRMTKRFDFGKGQLELVLDKAEKSHRTLTSRYGFRKEMIEYFRNNFDYRKEENQSYIRFIQAVKQKGQEYADAHRKIPIYNDAQYMAREAAISLGEYRFEDTIEHLEYIINLAKNPVLYSKEVSKIIYNGSKLNEAEDAWMTQSHVNAPTYPLPRDSVSYSNKQLNDDTTDWAGGKPPWYMSQEEFLKYHKTGFIGSHVYDDDNTFEWLGKSSYPQLITISNIKGHQVEFRKTGNINKYVATDNNDEIIRTDDGMATYMTDAEIREAGIPAEEQTIGIFDGDTTVGFVSNEWGAVGMWINKKYQGKGIGTTALHIFMSQNPHMQLGQMTNAGISTTNNVWNKFKDEGKWIDGT